MIWFLVAHGLQALCMESRRSLCTQLLFSGSCALSHCQMCFSSVWVVLALPACNQIWNNSKTGCTYLAAKVHGDAGRAQRQCDMSKQLLRLPPKTKGSRKASATQGDIWLGESSGGMKRKVPEPIPAKKGARCSSFWQMRLYFSGLC